ncbi:MAG TPA: hypothetical protein VH328_06640 [Burkholderiaceae bacterium]|nr:hypothetical protein [Burkholderiaceae bacterium]
MAAVSSQASPQVEGPADPPGAQAGVQAPAVPPGAAHRSREEPAPSDDVSLVAHGAGRRLRYLLVGGCAALVVTGLAWLVLHDWWLAPTAFGPQPHPASAWLLRLHGALAWLVTLVGGAVWQVHVRPAWRAVRRRQLHARRAGHTLRRVGHSRRRTISGVALVVGLVALLFSAIGLQYAPEDLHGALSAVHWVVGSALVVALAWHWVARRRS